MYSLNMILDMSITELENTDPNIIGMDRNNQITWPMLLKEQAQIERKAFNALLVIVNTEHIRDYLLEHDSKALQQCFDALGVFERVHED